MQQKQGKDRKGRPMLPIIVLLLSMASLAERAATLPAPVRYLMLYFLQRGEKSAYAIVYWELRKRGVPLAWAAPDHARTSRDPDAAWALGQWLRILALSLRDLPRRAWTADMQVRWRNASHGFLAISGLIVWTPLAPDTS